MYIFRGRGVFIDVYKADDKIATSGATSLADTDLRRTYRQCRYWIEYLFYFVLLTMFHLLVSNTQRLSVNFQPSLVGNVLFILYSGLTCVSLTGMFSTAFDQKVALTNLC